MSWNDRSSPRPLSPQATQARRKRLEAERAADALASIVSLQRRMVEETRERPDWTLPDPPEAA